MTVDKKPKILLVEDEVMAAWLLQMSLRRMGYTVCGPVATGEAAVQTAKEECPDVILMDIRLAGDMDGIEAARQIRATQDSLLIFMTGYSDPDIKGRAGNLEPTAYLVKPVTPDHIVPVIAQYLGA